MPSSIDYRSTSAHPAQRVYTTMVDKDILEKRLVQMGGPGAALLEYEPQGEGVKFTLRHGIDQDDLPPMVTKLIPGDVVIKRTETWSASAQGGYDGVGRVAIAGTPATAKATMRMADIDGGSELVVNIVVTVKVPIVGAKVEEAVGEQIKRLLEAETGFTIEQIQG
ncbi:MAG: DUF2505 domain-containing protein [Pseudonocardia sp.]|nr:DUF2505 domain-containing protein [Pseudonocardia sp.]